MRIETYTKRYEDDVAKLIADFHLEALNEYDSEISAQAITDTIRQADHSNAFLLIVEEKAVGILYGTRLRSPTNGREIFQEVMWFVDERFRSRGVWLLREVENILKSQGVGIMIMAVLENSKTDKLKALYERLGFRHMESHYCRAI